MINYSTLMDGKCLVIIVRELSSCALTYDIDIHSKIFSIFLTRTLLSLLGRYPLSSDTTLFTPTVPSLLGRYPLSLDATLVIRTLPSLL